MVQTSDLIEVYMTEENYVLSGEIDSVITFAVDTRFEYEDW